MRLEVSVGSLRFVARGFYSEPQRLGFGVPGFSGYSGFMVSNFPRSTLQIDFVQEMVRGISTET